MKGNALLLTFVSTGLSIATLLQPLQTAYSQTDYEEFIIMENINQQKINQQNIGGGSSTNIGRGTNTAGTNLAPDNNMSKHSERHTNPRNINEAGCNPKVERSPGQSFWNDIRKSRM